MFLPTLEITPNKLIIVSTVTVAIASTVSVAIANIIDTIKVDCVLWAASHFPLRRHQNQTFAMILAFRQESATKRQSADWSACSFGHM